MSSDSDPHGWLRDKEDPRVLQHLEAENRATTDALAHTVELSEQIFAEIKARVKETDLSVPVAYDGWSYYSRTITGQSYGVHCRRPEGADESAEQTILDENHEAADSEYFEVGVFEVSPDHSLLLWGADRTGDEKFTLFVRDLSTGVDTEVGVTDASYGSAWANDNTTFFTVRCDDTERPYQVVRHQLGRSETEVVFTEDDGRFFVAVGRERDDSFIQIITGSSVSDEIWIIPADEPHSDFRCFEPRRPNVEYSVGHHGDRFYILTNDGAQNFRICSTPDTDTGASNWVEVVAERPDVMISSFDAFASHLVLFVRADGMTQIRIRSWESDDEAILNQPEPVYSTWPGLNVDSKAEVLRFGYGSMVSPAAVLTHNFASGERIVLKQTEVLGNFDSENYVTERLWATSADGTKVPISYVQHKNRPPGPGPVVLYGYGAYEVSVDPAFSVARLSLLDRGFGFAIAHVRGGGEFGRQWYLDGKMQNKPNTFADAVAAAQYLIDQEITTAAQMCLRGGSAGGLLVGAVLNQAPELFGAAVAEVPFVDVLNTMSDPSLPLTQTEWDEWGDPTSSADVHELIRSYSPYDNVDAKEYPAIFATGGFSDPRVGYWEPAKWILRLRERNLGDKPVLLWTELGAGHGGPSGRYAAWADEARTLSFIIDQVGQSQPAEILK